MHEYDGSFSIDAAAQYGYEDVTPPYREGYAFKVEAFDFIMNGNDTANTMSNVFVGLSAKSPARTSFPLSDGLASDIMRLHKSYFITDDQEVISGDCCSNGMRRMDDKELFLTSVRIFARSKAVVATEKAIYVRYRIRLSEVKLTQRDKDELLKRQYGC